ncbi:MAG: hypothetical protein AB2740_20270 [Candidatus Thiodiazotropha sp.]
MDYFDDPTGLITFSLVTAVVVAVPIARMILAHYRQRISDLMRVGGTPPEEQLVERPGPNSELVLEYNPAHSYAFESKVGSSGFVALVYAVAGIIWAALATVLTFEFNEIDSSPGKIVALGGVFLWPVAPLVMRMGAWGRRAEILGPLAVFGVTLLVGTMTGGGVAGAILAVWAITILPPIATFVLVSWLGVPSVGPWVAGFLGAWILVIYVGLAGIVSLVTASDAVVTAFLITALATAVFVGRGVVRRVARLYTLKKVSEEMLSADVWWIVFTGWLCVWLSIPGETLPEKWLGVLLGALAFVAYRVVVSLGLRTIGMRKPGPRLLLLRVFGQSRRSERLLDSVGRRWRRLGSIQLIAAPDVAAGTLDPQELIEFLAGRLDRAFVKDAYGLEARMSDLDLAPDPDGTHRITEFFCQDDAWRMTLQRLARDANVVLMDLRGFGRENAGCIYELGQLVDLVPTSQTVLIVDDDTDEEFLSHTLHGMWAKLRADSPNRGETPSPLRVIVAHKKGREPTDRILSALARLSSNTRDRTRAVAQI